MAKQNFEFMLAAHSWGEAFTGLSSGSSSSYLNFPWIFALIKTKLACGKGYTFNTENEKLKTFWNNFVDKSKFDQKISDLMFNTYRYGVGYAGFTKLNNPNNDFRMFVCKQDHFKPFITKTFEDILAFSTLTENTTSTYRPYYVLEKWDYNKVERTYWYDKKQIFNYDRNVPIPKEYFLASKQTNPYGFVPFEEFPNYQFSTNPDWMPVMGQINLYQKTVDNLMWELDNNRTRIFMSLTPKQKQEYDKMWKRPGAKWGDIIVELQPDAGADKPVLTVAQSQIKLAEYTQSLSDQIKNIFSLSGLSYNAVVEGNATATEISYNNSGLTNTIIHSQRAFNENMTKLLNKLFSASGFSDVEFTFMLNENTAIDQNTIIDQTIKSLTYGLISKEQAIATIQNIPIADAQLVLEKIEKENQESKLVSTDSGMVDKETYNTPINTLLRQSGNDLGKSNTKPADPISESTRSNLNEGK